MVVATPQLAASSLSGNVADGLKRPPRLTVSEWADEHRVLAAKYSSEPGPWRTDRAPYLREIMDSLNDPGVSRVTLVKSARVGGTEAMNNQFLYTVDSDPGPGLWVMPTEMLARKELKGRIRAMLEDCARVKRRVVKLTDTLLTFTTMVVWPALAASPVTLTSNTCRYVWFDELDNCQKAAGALGNHLSVAAERTTTYGYRGKVMACSTPSTPDAAAWQEWQTSDQRRFHVPCPLCGHFQVLQFDNIVLRKGSEKQRNGDVIEAGRLAEYACEGCNGRIPETERAWMVDRGVWVPDAQSIDQDASTPDAPVVVGDKPITRRIGFHIWSAYSPWRSWSLILAEFFRVYHNTEKRRVFWNSWLGLPWEDTVEDVPPDLVRDKRIDSYPRDMVPEGVDFLVCASDVQADRVYYIVRGWCKDRSSYLIREGVCGHLSDLDLILHRKYRRMDGGTPMPVSYAAIDTGYRTKEVYDYVRAAGTERFHAVKGFAETQSGTGAPIRPSEIDYLPDGSKSRESIILWRINVDHYKEVVYRHSRVEAGKPEAWYLCADASEAYCTQFTAEHRVRVMKAGRIHSVWKPRTEGAANHYLDGEVYGAAIALMYNEAADDGDPQAPTDWFQQTVRR